MGALVLPLIAMAIGILITATTYLTFKAHRREKLEEKAQADQGRGFQQAGRYRSR